MKNYLKTKLSFNKFLIGIFILFFLIILGGFGKILWQYKSLSEQNVAVLFPNAIASGGSAQLAIYAWDIYDAKMIEKGEVKIDLLDSEKKKIVGLYTGELTNGSVLAKITLPDLAEGQYTLKTTLESENGEDEIFKTINIKTQSKIFISTDRPLYQPGQTVNFRALVLGSDNLMPAADKEIVVSVNNPKGDTIFRQSYTTSQYGIIGGQFGFADELTFGEYKIMAAGNGQTVVKSVTVKQFTLPKFEIKIEPDQNLSEKPARITGHIEAKYFFGKPVVGADAKISLFIADEEMKFSQNTDDNGLVNFVFTPNYQGEPKTIRIEATVSGEGSEAVSQQKSYPVTADGVLIELIPESGKLKPGLDNRILLISSKPDGTPLKTTIFMTGEKLREFATDEFGIATFTYRPDKGSSLSRFTLNVRDADGNALVKNFELQNEINDAGYLILRPARTVLAGGDNFSLEISGTNDTVTSLEFIQSGQVVYADTVKPVNGIAAANIELPKNIFGTVEVRATQIFYAPKSVYYDRRGAGNNTRVVSDSKFILVDQANSLTIGIEKDKESYRPGEEARVTFTVNNESGTPENSALGVSIVDEALLALATDDTFSRRLLLVNDKISANAKAINGLDWQKVMDDGTLATRDLLLAAMFQDVPREQDTLSEVVKDNKAVWQSFEDNKQDKLQTLLWLFFFGFLFLNLKLWWLITGAAVKQKAGLSLWGSALLVFIVGSYVFSLFRDDHYYSVWDRFGEAYTLGAGFWDAITEFSHLYLIILVLLVGVGFLVWNYRVWLKAYWRIAQYYTATLAALFLLSVIYKLDLGLGEGSWTAILFVGFISIIVGLSGLLAIFYLDKYEFTVASWVYVLLTGVALYFVAPAIIPFYIVLIVFSVIHKAAAHADEEIDDMTAKIERLKNQLAVQNKDDRQVELEIALLRKEIEEGAAYSAVGRVVVVIITVLALLYFVGIIREIVVLNSVPAANNMLWGDYATTGGLANNDPREIAGSFIKVFFGLAGIIASLFTVWGGIIWLKRPKDRAIRKKANMMLVVGTIGMLVILVVFAITQFIISALYSATGASDGGGYSSRSLGGPAATGIGGGGGVDNMLWGGYEGNVQMATGLGDTDARSMVAGLIPDFGLGKEKSAPAAPGIRENTISIGEEKKEAAGYAQAEWVRKFFPETMFWRAELIAADGRAELTVPVNDSITRWKLSALANSLSGKVGSGEGSLITFQDFFLDFNLPFNLTRGDEFVLPVNLYNYMSAAQNIKLTVREDSWFTLLNENNREFALSANEVRTVYLTIRLERYGDFTLRIDAQGTRAADAVEKSVSILPFGQRTTQTVASEEFQEDKGEYQALLPADTIPGTEKISVKIFPSVLSEIIAGLENILRFPSGCFEQTSSSLYPDILVLKYLQSSGQDKPEIRKKAEDFITKGVQRLLTYEIEPGGFSYFGHAPAETVLTAYGLMEFSEMRGVTFLDEDLISRTKEFLYNKQKSNGSFTITGYHSGGFSGGDELAKNVYIIWALSESDPKENRLSRSIAYLENNLAEIKKSPYALALAANVLVNYEPDAKSTREAIAALKQAVEIDENRRAHVELKKPNHYGSYGQYGNIEVTALAAIAFARAGENEFSDKLNDYIVAYRDGHGTWGSTQATVMALKALIANEAVKKQVKDNEGKIKITFNGGDEKIISVTPDNSEVVQSVEFSDRLGPENTIGIAKEGKIRATLQIVKDYYREWAPESADAPGTLSVERMYGTGRKAGEQKLITEFGVGEPASLYVILKSGNNMQNTVAEIPIPAGFSVDVAALECQVRDSKGSADCPVYYANSGNKVSRYENKGDRVILYFDEFAAGNTKIIEIPVTPRYTGKFKMMPARFYAYYDPGQEDFSRAIDNIAVGEKAVIGDILTIPGLTGPTPTSSQFQPIPPFSSPSPSNQENICHDSDGGKNYYTSGLTTVKLNGAYINSGDFCVVSGQTQTLTEYYCENNLLRSENYVCSNGCVMGRCINKCTDSDNGANYYTLGICIDNVYPAGFSDVCQAVGSYNLRELFCDNNNLCQSRFYACPNGCLNGVCAP